MRAFYFHCFEIPFINATSNVSVQSSSWNAPKCKTGKRELGDFASCAAPYRPVNILGEKLKPFGSDVLGDNYMPRNLNLKVG